MNERGEEFMKSIGNDGPGHEFYDDVDFEEVGFVPADQYEDELLKYPVIKRFIKPEDDLKKLNDMIEKEVKNNMGNLKDEAQAYEPKQTLNIADLDQVDISLPIEDRDGIDGDGKPFEYKVLVVDDKEYRTPGIVLGEIKKIIKLRPDAQFVSVSKSGAGISTKYEVELVEPETEQKE